MSAKQVINDKLKETVNNQIEKGLLLSLWVKKIKIGDYLAKLQERDKIVIDMPDGEKSSPVVDLQSAGCPTVTPRYIGLYCSVFIYLVKFSHTRYRALGPELIPVYRQSARR